VVVITYGRLVLLGLPLACMLGGGVQAATPNVLGVDPGPLSTAPTTNAIRIDFDEALDTTSVDGSSFRVFGNRSGPAQGVFSFSNGDQSVTFKPDRRFSSGETVTVNLSHDIRASDASPLRSAGYTYQFRTSTLPSHGRFRQVDSMSNRTSPSVQTRIYGANGVDLNGDGFPDLTTVNEVSADLRVFLNRADGSGTFHPFLTPVPIALEISPNEASDFDGDGNADICVSSALSDSVWIVLGDGDGTFGSTQEVSVGNEPHGVAVLDVDGDGDPDIVTANRATNNLSLLLNDGSGVFGAPSFFEGGVDGEYGLTAGDVDGDGIGDLVVGAYNGEQIRALLGNGDGTFTQATSAQDSGGLTWVVVLGDLDGDGDLDATTANSLSGTGAVLLGNGDGSFDPPSIFPTVGAHILSTDVGDLDGDGDLDWVLSNFLGTWKLYTNDGTGTFTFDQEFSAPSKPACATLYDADDDGDLDMALSDEFADVILLMENRGPIGVPTLAPWGGALLALVLAVAAMLSAGRVSRVRPPA
jgi:hypothetical protein